MVRPADGRASRSRGWWSCAPCRRASRSTATSCCRTARQFSHALLADHGALVRPELLTQLGLAVGDQLAHRRRAVHDPRRDRAGAGPARRRVQPRPARAHRPTTICASTGLLGVRQPRAATRCCSRCRRPASSRWSRTLRARLPDRVRQRALVPLDRGPDRRGFRSRRELPEPRRLRHRHPRRHRRVERHARVRPAEDPQHRDPQVPRRDDAADPRGLRAAGAGRSGWPAACSASALARAGARGDPGVLGARRSAQSRYGADRGARSGRASASACSSRCCSRSCRCSRSAASSRRCCCATDRRGPGGRPGSGWWTRRHRSRLASDRLDAGRRRAAVGVALVAVAAWQAASLRVGLVVCAGFAGVALVLHLARRGARPRRRAAGAVARRSRCGTRC